MPKTFILSLHAGERRKNLAYFWCFALILLESPPFLFLDVSNDLDVKGPQTPFGRLCGRSPAGTCRHTNADRRARLRQTMLLFHIQTSVPSALFARLPPNLHANPNFALLAEYRGLPVTRPAEHARRRTDLGCR
jgi:hypothetical protein